jgi:hypothetical protein
MSTDQPIEEFKAHGLVVKMYQDENPPDPRTDWDNLGRILYYRGSGRYKLGDETATIEEMQEIIADKKQFIALPVYTLIHSGIAMKTTDFGDPWDSGQSGIIYTWVNKALKAFLRKKMTPKLRERVKATLRAEVKTFGEYLNGEVYGYSVEDEDGDVLDALWGIFDYDYAKKTAREAAKLAKKTQRR